tara:strand:- start:815 stop:1228 length:414 start_codon:yes stop_codon:yes gene_type:complete
MIKFRMSEKKIKNISIAVFTFLGSFLFMAGGVYYFISTEERKEEIVIVKEDAFENCEKAGVSRQFRSSQDNNSITFYHPNLRNNAQYSAIISMVATANACFGFELSDKHGACIGPACDNNQGRGIPFHFTLELSKGV